MTSTNTDEETITLTRTEFEELMDRIPGRDNPEVLFGWIAIWHFMRREYGWTWYKILRYRWELIHSTAVGFTFRKDSKGVNRRFARSDTGELRRWVRLKFRKKQMI